MDTSSNQEPITICTMKWRPPESESIKGSLHQMYGSAMVNYLYYDLKRNVGVPFNFVCITDDVTGLDSRILTSPIPTRLMELPDSWAKLYLFSEEMKTVLGRRFCYLDMDAIVTDSLDELLNREEEMIIARFTPYEKTQRNLRKRPSRRNAIRWCNSCFMIMDSGAATFVWEDFPLNIARYPHNNKPEYLKPYKGSDQAWISYVMHNNFADGDVTTVSPDNGVYEFKQLKNKDGASFLPTNAKFVAFGGQDHPYKTETRQQAEWIGRYRKWKMGQ